MRNNLLKVLTTIILFLISTVSFAQAPALGTAANFVLFTTVGAVTNSGITYLTHLTGNVGSNSGSTTGFGNVDGVMHNGDGASATCSADLLTLYNQLNIATPTFFPAPLLGNGDTLIPGIYHISAAATMNLNLILNAQGNPNAVFIFQIGGSFSTGANSKVIMINSGLACNVFWKVEGLVSMAAGTTMRGTIVAHNAAINMGANDTLEGRALSIAGAITTNSDLAYTPTGCGSPSHTGPAAPALASTACYGLFSTDGPVTNTGITHVSGDVGTNVGLTTGYNPLFITGAIHPIPDGSTAACAADLLGVYNYLETLPYDIELLFPAQFGHNLVLTPHTYLMNSAVTFTDTVYLSGEGNVNAVFVIQINGALSTSTFSKVILTNGTQAKNVFWKVDGAVNINDNSIFNGTIICNNAAITLNTGDTINGRALTTTGALLSHAVTINVPPGCGTTCVAPAIGGANQVCAGLTTTLTNPDTGGRWSSNNISVAAIGSASGIVSGLTPGACIITFTSSTGCVSSITFTVNPAPSVIAGPSAVCTGSSVTLTDATTGGSWTSSNTLQATAGSGTGIITGIATGTPVITYTISTGCVATKMITVSAVPSAGTITGPSAVCIGLSIGLIDAVPGGVWSSSNTSATVSGGTVTGIAAGTDTIRYTVTNACNTVTATKTVIVSPLPNPGTITGLAGVCVASTILLSDIVTGGVWSSSITTATVSGGTVTGVAAGTDTIRYSVTNACSTVAATKTITINPLPDAGSITGLSSVCAGSVILLSDGVTGGIWSSSNARATVSGGSVTGVTPGLDTIKYAVTNACGTVIATKAISVVSFPYAGIITGPISVCQGNTITLSDIAGGGIWSSGATSFATVSVSGNVYGVSAGVVLISYTVTNACGLAFAMRPVNVLSIIACNTLGNTIINMAPADLKLYPNPNHGAFTLKGSLGTYDVEAELAMTNVIGQVVYSNKVVALNGNINVQVQLSNALTTGVYILTVNAAGQKMIFHVVVE